MISGFVGAPPEHLALQQAQLPPTLPPPASTSPASSGTAVATPGSVGPASLTPQPLTTDAESGPSPARLPLTSPAAAAVAAAAAAGEGRAVADVVAETRLASLEQAWHEKLAALQSLEQRYQAQHDELAKVRSTLDESRQELRRLEEAVGTQSQRDVESLEQLSRTLQQLLHADASQVSREVSR